MHSTTGGIVKDHPGNSGQKFHPQHPHVMPRGNVAAQLSLQSLYLVCVQILALSAIHCVILGKQLNYTMPQFLHLHY